MFEVVTGFGMSMPLCSRLEILDNVVVVSEVRVHRVVGDRSQRAPTRLEVVKYYNSSWCNLGGLGLTKTYVISRHEAGRQEARGRRHEVGN